MNYLKNKIKTRTLLLLLSSMMILSPSIFNVNNKVNEVKALPGECYMAIDSSKGIGYLSPTLEDFMTYTNYHCSVDLTEHYEHTIFLQNDYQGSSTFLDDIRTVLIIDKISVRNCNCFFEGLANLEEIVNIGNLDVSMCDNFERMFDECPKLKNIDFTDFDVSKCGDLSFMFYGSSFETLDLSGFDTSSCGDFSYMFGDCSELTSLDLSSFNTRNASKMQYMISGCSSLEYLDISNFDLSNYPMTEDFFRGTKPKIIKAPKKVPEPNEYHTNVINFYLPLVTSEPFYYYDYNLDNYTYVAPTEKSVTYYNEDIKNTVVDYSSFALSMFEEIKDSIPIDVDDLRNGWDILSNLDFSQFYCEEDYQAILTILKTCKVDTVNETVSEWLTLYEDLYKTYCHALIDCGGDFLSRCPNALNPDGLVHIGINTDDGVGYISSVDSYEILKSDLKTKIDLSTSTIENSIFSLIDSNEYENINKVIIQDEIVISDCKNLFKGLENVISIEGITNLSTESITSCSSMFEGCSSLETIDLSFLDTDSVYEADRMFKDCTNLVEINSLSFISKSLISISEMFSGCESLSLLDLSNFDLTNVINAVDCLNRTSFLYLYTPKAMPTKGNCDLNLYFPVGNPNFTYYDLGFKTYEKLPKDVSSILIISSVGKIILDNICNGFIKDCEYYCSLDGNTSEQSLIKLWEYQTEEFSDHIIDTPNECLLAFFKQDNSSSTDLKLKEFCEKYDYIYSKYKEFLDNHGGDFANRSQLINFVNNKLPIKFFENKNKETKFAIILIVAIIGVGLFVFYKKDKFAR